MLRIVTYVREDDQASVANIARCLQMQYCGEAYSFLGFASPATADIVGSPLTSHRRQRMKIWSKPSFVEIAMDCEINSYFDELGEERDGQFAR